MKKNLMIYRHVTPVWVNKTATCKKWGWLDEKVEDIEVEVMAIIKGYAMVRRKSGYPIVVKEKTLYPVTIPYPVEVAS